MPTYHSFTELDCYQKCRAVRNWVNAFLDKEGIQDRDFIQNIRRAARSSTRNIAEGFGRHHHRENMQFCRIALGSLHEILDDLTIAVDEGRSTEQGVAQGRKLVYAALKSTRGYINYLGRL